MCDADLKEMRALVAKTVLANYLELGVETLLFEWTTRLLECLTVISVELGVWLYTHIHIHIHMHTRSQYSGLVSPFHLNPQTHSP